MESKTLIVPADAAPVRIDLFLARELSEHFSRTKLKQLIDQGFVQLNGIQVKPHTKVEAGAKVTISYELEVADTTRAQDIPLEIVYEDDDLVVVNKQAGLVVHPACGNPDGTLVNALLHHIKELSAGGSPERPGIVHRLDKDTSGILIVAKNDFSHRGLAKQFLKHQVDRIYWVVVRGIVQHDEMKCEDALGRSIADRRKVIVTPSGGKEAVTYFRVLERFKKASLLEAKPMTGRTHQIRVHLKSLGYPVLGDEVYGMKSPWIRRQALHAKSLGVVHPRTGKSIFFESEIPSDMQQLLEHLKSEP